MNHLKPKIHTKDDFKSMHKAGQLAAQCLDFLTTYVQEGVTTNELNNLCNQFALDHQAICAPLNYRGFPKSICTSINDVVCHGIPSSRALKKGDIINIDVTLIVDGWYGDTSRMFCIEPVKPYAKKLVNITYECMMRAIELVKPGAHLGDIGNAIETLAHDHGFSVVKDFCGHGLGQKFHAPPNVFHWGEKGEGLELEPGMFFTIEPMINQGRYDVRIKSDQWTAVTKDRSLSAQFEHSLGVTETGYEIFTQSPKNWNFPPYF